MAILPIIGAGAAIAGAVGGFAEGTASQGDAAAAARARAEANIIRNKENKITAQRQREMDIAKVREKRSEITTYAASQGQLGASSVQTSQGSLQSQLASNIGYGTQMQALEDEYLQKENEAIEYGSNASEESQNASAFQQIGSSIDQFMQQKF